jgi:hypothetical protein
MDAKKGKIGGTSSEMSVSDVDVHDDDDRGESEPGQPECPDRFADFSEHVIGPPLDLGIDERNILISQDIPHSALHTRPPWPAHAHSVV